MAQNTEFRTPSITTAVTISPTIVAATIVTAAAAASATATAGGQRDGKQRNEKECEGTFEHNSVLVHASRWPPLSSDQGWKVKKQ